MELLASQKSSFSIFLVLKGLKHFENVKFLQRQDAPKIWVFGPTLTPIYPSRHVTFPVFSRILWIFFCGKIHFWDSHKNEKKTGPDVETIYFVSIEQKKYNFLQKLANVLVSKKDEVICSSNKYIRKLVNVYIMLFIQNQKKKKTEKELKKNNEKAYHSYHYSLGYYLK